MNVKFEINVKQFEVMNDKMIQQVKHGVEKGVKDISAQILDSATDIVYNQKSYETKEKYESKSGFRTGNLGRSYMEQYTWTGSSYTAILSNKASYFPYVELGTGIYAVGGRQTPWCYQDAQGIWHWTKGQRGKYSFTQALNIHYDNIVPTVNKWIQYELGGI